MCIQNNFQLFSLWTSCQYFGSLSDRLFNICPIFVVIDDGLLFLWHVPANAAYAKPGFGGRKFANRKVKRRISMVIQYLFIVLSRLYLNVH